MSIGGASAGRAGQTRRCTESLERGGRRDAARVRFVEVSKATDDFLAALLSQVGAAADRPTVDGVKMRGRPVHINRVDRPEYETLAMMGANLGIGSSLDVMDGNDACNRLGIDTISGGAALSFMCESALRGWLPEGWADHFPAPFDFTFPRPFRPKNISSHFLLSSASRPL